MIRDDVYSAICGIQDVVMERGCIAPKPNTVLAAAFGEGYSVEDSNHALREAFDATLDQYADKAADAIVATIDIARNIINPLIRKIVPIYERELEEAGKVNYLPIILETKVPDIYYNQMLNTIIEPYAKDGIKYDQSVGYNCFYEITASNIDLENSIKSPDFKKFLSDVLSKGVTASVVDDLTSKFSGMDLGTYYDLISKLYGVSVRDLNSLEKSISEYGELSNIETADRLLLLWATVSYVSKAGKGAKYPGFISDKGYESMVAVSDKAYPLLSTLLVARMKSAIATANTDKVEVYRNSKDLTIQVNEGRYNQYLDSSGTPEAVYGYALYQRLEVNKENSEPYLNAILAKTEFYTKYYNAWLSNVTRKTELDVLIKAREILTNLCMGALRNDDRVKETLVIDLDSIERRMKSIVDELDRHEINDYVVVIRKVLVLGAFPHTEAYEFLDHIDMYGRENPGSTTEEQAYMASEDILAMWLTSQMSQTK